MNKRGNGRKQYRDYSKQNRKLEWMEKGEEVKETKGGVNRRGIGSEEKRK